MGKFETKKGRERGKKIALIGGIGEWSYT